MALNIEQVKTIEQRETKIKKLLSDYWSCYKSYNKDTYGYVIEN